MTALISLITFRIHFQKTGQFRVSMAFPHLNTASVIEEPLIYYYFSSDTHLPKNGSLYSVLDSLSKLFSKVSITLAGINATFISAFTCIL